MRASVNDLKWSVGRPVVVVLPSLRDPGIIGDEAIPAATSASGLFLVVLRPLQLLHPLELPTNLPLIFLVIEVEHGPYEVLVLDPIPTTLRPYPTR